MPKAKLLDNNDYIYSNKDTHMLNKQWFTNLHKYLSNFDKFFLFFPLYFYCWNECYLSLHNRVDFTNEKNLTSFFTVH